jgi:hypothetical protein
MSRSFWGRRAFAAIMLSLTVLVVNDLYSGRASAGDSDQDRRLPAKFAGEDTVTSLIRSRSSVLSRVYVGSAADRQKASSLGRVVSDNGSFVIVARSKAEQAKQYGLEEQVLETTVHLPGASFEPLTESRDNSLRLGAAATAPGKGYYILQFGAPPSDEWLRSIYDAGVEVLQYIPHQAFFVYGEADAIARVAGHSRVRWIGEFRPEHKLSPSVRDQIEAAQKNAHPSAVLSKIELTGKDRALFDVAVFARADVDAVAAELQARFGARSVKISRLSHNFIDIVRADLRLTDLQSITGIADVFAIEPVIAAKNEDERANQILAGNYLNPTTILGPGYNPLNQFGADGTNVTVSVVDDGIGIPGEGGFYLSSLNAVNAPLRGAGSGAVGHGHLNATLIAGSNPFGPTDSLFYNYGLGVAPRAHIISIPRNRTGYTGTNAEVYNDSVITPGPNGVHGTISNNSWGIGLNGNAYAAAVEGVFDGFVLDASLGSGVDPITLIFSAGNEGANGLTRPKVAKNLIAVGNSEGTRSDLGGTAANNIDDLASDSSRGPAADGRIKPDIVAPGTAVTGGRSGTDSLRGNIDAFHRWSSGTSHSAAHVTGLVALFTDWWARNNFNDRPTPSLVKAALINSAQDMNGENSSGAVPNGNEGWGRPNMKFMMNTGVGMKYSDEQIFLLDNGNGFDLNGSVADGTKPLRVTLVWTDPPGTADPALVNNLDLTVTVNGVVYKGNVFSNGVSVTGGVYDNRNNVEGVILPAGIAAGSPLNVNIRATALAGDGILNNGDQTDQSFSLVVYNWSNVVSPGFYTVAGRVVSPSGRGIGYAKVRLTDSQGIAREKFTNPLGYFSFTSLAGGQQYTVNVSSKRHTFTQQTISLNGNMTSVNIVSNSPSGP